MHSNLEGRCGEPIKEQKNGGKCGKEGKKCGECVKKGKKGWDSVVRKEGIVYKLVKSLCGLKN